MHQADQRGESHDEIRARWDKALAAATRNYNAEKTVERITGKPARPTTKVAVKARAEAKENAAPKGDVQMMTWEIDTPYDFGITQYDINQYVEDAYIKANDVEFKQWAAAKPRLINDVQDGIPDIAEYNHALRDNDIRHVKISHGEETKEKYPVTKNDQKLIPYIVKNYDKVIVKRKNGKPGLVYVKVMGDNLVYYLESVTTEYHGKKLLVNKQMIKTGMEDIPNDPDLIKAI